MQIPSFINPPFALLLFVAAMLFATFPGTATATVTPIAEGSVTWGVKESWRHYAGQGTVSEGASVNPDGTYEFPVVSGSYDDETGTTTLQLTGAVRWQNYLNYPHPGKYGLDTTFRNLSLHIGPNAQEIRGDNIGYAREDPGGELHEELDVVLARLEIDGAETSFEAGQSEWNAVPTQAGPGLALYPPGIAIDPVTARYSGPGGLPQAERWDLPGGPALQPGGRWVSALSFGAYQDSARRIYVSPAGDVVHVLELTGADTEDPSLTLTARDAQTLAQVGTSAELAVGDLTTAYDPETETIFYLSQGAQTTVRSARWDPGAPGYAFGEVGELRAGRRVDGLAWNPVTEEIAATNELRAADGGSQYVNEEIRAFREVSGVWTETVEAPLPLPTSPPFGETAQPGEPFRCGFGIAPPPCLGVLRDGSYVQAPGEAHVYTTDPDVAWPAIHIAIDGAGEAETGLIEGTEAQHLGAGSSLGFTATAPGADGSLLLHNTAWGRMAWARVDVEAGEAVLVEDPYDVGEHGNGDEVASFGRAAAADLGHGWEWLTAEFDPESFVLNAMRERVFVGRFKYPELNASYLEYPAIGVGPDGSLYIPVKDKDTGRFGYQVMQYVGSRAELAEQPDDATATLTAGEASEEVSFTSTVTGGEPPPTRQWQAKGPGEPGFVDITGETGATLSVDATRGMNGSRYRAVYTSAAGKIVSDEASLTVDYAPALLAQPQSQTVTEGNDAVFFLVAEAHPEATITWQRWVSGSWQEIADGDEEFEPNGPALTVPGAEPGQSGAVLRAKLTNTVGTTYSDPVTLTVRGQVVIPPGGLDLKQVSLEWSGNEEMQVNTPAGTPNYFSAGASAGDQATYTSVQGNAAVYQISSSGSESLATWATRAAHVKGGGEQLVRLYGGDAHIEPDGSATVRWDGEFSVNFYGGLVPFTFADPELVVDADGTGTLVAEMSGYSSSIENPGERTPLTPEADVTVATFSGVEVDPAGEVEVHPDYAGVEVTGDPTKPQERIKPGWGAWPQPFVDFHVKTGLAAYWYSSGSTFDSNKAPDPFTVDFQGEAAPSGPPREEPLTDTQAGQGTPQQGSPPAAQKPLRLTAVKRTQKLGAKRAARLATLSCPKGTACRLSAPRRVWVKLAGRRYPLPVLAPKRIGAGKRVTLRLRFPAPALAALAKRKRPTTVRLRLRAGEQAHQVRVTLRSARGEVRIVQIAIRKLGKRGGSSSPHDISSAPISAEPPLLQRPPTAVDVSAVRLAWYPRDSWLRYASSGTAPGDGINIANGATATNSTASSCPDRSSSSDAQLPYAIEFAPKASWYDPPSGIAGVYGQGSVNFRWKGHSIDLTVSDPEIEVNGASSRAIFRFSGSGGTAYPNQRADLLSLDTAGRPTLSNGGKTLTYDLMRGTLTPNGVNVFAGFYTPPDNDEFGCVSVSFTLP